MSVIVSSQRLHDEISQMNLAQMSQTTKNLIETLIRYDYLDDMDDDVSDQIMRVIDELVEQIGERYTEYRGE